MKSKLLPILLLAANWPFLQTVFANNVVVSNITLTGKNAASGFTLVQFDITWENSWRVSSGPANWDAAWVFVKYSTNLAGGAFQHATLHISGHTAPTGSTIDTPNDGKGIFIYRDADGAGTNNLSGVQLRWNYGADGVADNAVVQLKVFAIEMVFVPTAEFAVGSGGTGSAELTLTTINTAVATTAPSGSGSLGGQAGGHPTGSRLTNASWPNGFSAFYCMKYEITQEQYADFLNTLMSTQAAARNPSENTFRYSISGTHSNLSSSKPFVACNFLSWMDGCAYADWAGLRPMTELEFEKACRGNQLPIPDEFAWGNNNITAASGITNDGAANEVPSNTGANCVFGNSGTGGPLRVGSFATSSNSREDAGASFWGIMELTGNLFEKAVTLGNITGRNFAGTHGDGLLSTNGHATNMAWPGYASGEVTGAVGSGFRGGSFIHSSIFAQVSDRNAASDPQTDRWSSFGFRCVRSAQ